MLPGKGAKCLVETPVEAATLKLWFGEDWSGDPAQPLGSPPSGPDAKLLVIAADVAVMAADPTRHNALVNWHGIGMRADSAQAAVDAAPPVMLRRGFHRSEVEVKSRTLPYARYFDIEDTALSHPTFAGGMSAIVHRTCLRAADAVTVLPYDPKLDLLLLVEQFRPGAFSRGDPHPWVLEPVAGRVDKSEPPEAVAHREAEEEANLTLSALHKIGDYYPSPGAMTEYLTSFVGLCDLSQHTEGVHGLETEGEDIRTHILTFAEAMELTQTGEADNGPLLLSLYWLQAHRDDLRAGAGTA